MSWKDVDERMNGFKVYYSNGCCDECGNDDEVLIGYFAGEPTLEKLRKIARGMFGWMTDEQFKEVAFPESLDKFYWLRNGWHKCNVYEVEKIEFKEI